MGWGGGGGEEGTDERGLGAGEAVEADGELEAGGFGGAERDDVGGDAGVGVVLAGDGVTGDGAGVGVGAGGAFVGVVGGPEAERVPAGPALGRRTEVEAGEGFYPGAVGGDGVPGGDQLAEGGAGVVDGGERFTAIGVGGEGERAAGIEVERGAVPGGEGAVRRAEASEAGDGQLAPSVWSASVGSSTIL